jgi:hypothetical protein
MKHLKQKHGLLLIGIALGIAYGLLTRLVFGQNATLASVNYLFVIPLILGMIPLMVADHEKLTSYRNIIFIPWLTVATFFIVMFSLGIEDFLCLLILSAPFFVLGTVGAFIYRIIQINRRKNKGKLLTIVLLPFLFAPLEACIESPSETYTVNSEVLISAPSSVIWNNIVEVKAIKPTEYTAGFFNALGIPRPISASVNGKTIGARRIGNFEGGLKFIETITTYQENKKVSFSIAIDPATVRQRVFDQHVLNGNYFTFVDASYELIQLNNKQVKLRLSSSYQLTSTLNFYGKFWSDILLADFQDRLLKVIEKRCEAAE